MFDQHWKGLAGAKTETRDRLNGHPGRQSQPHALGHHGNAQDRFSQSEGLSRAYPRTDTEWDVAVPLASARMLRLKAFGDKVVGHRPINSMPMQQIRNNTQQTSGRNAMAADDFGSRDLAPEQRNWDIA